MRSRLFLHSASICAGSTTQAALEWQQRLGACALLQCTAGLPLQLKEKLAELWGGGRRWRRCMPRDEQRWQRRAGALVEFELPGLCTS